MESGFRFFALRYKMECNYAPSECRVWMCAIDVALTWSWHSNDRNSLARERMTRNCSRHIFSSRMLAVCRHDKAERVHSIRRERETEARFVLFVLSMIKAFLSILTFSGRRSEERNHDVALPATRRWNVTLAHGLMETLVGDGGRSGRKNGNLQNH